MEIARNKYHELEHGWFAVKNRSSKEIADGVSIKMRHEREKSFFNTISPWNTLPKDRCGVDHLKKYLSGLLSEHIRSEFPALVREIHGLRDKSQAQLSQLGDARQTNSQQRQYLTAIATRYQRRVDDALAGNYGYVGNQGDRMKLRKVRKGAAPANTTERDMESRY